MDIFKIKDSPLPIFKTLQLYFGVGYRLALQICRLYGISPNCSTKTLPSSKFLAIKFYLEKMKNVENKLVFLQDEIIKRLVINKSYRGVRLNSGLPVRGQRTKSNGRTQKKRKHIVNSKK